MKKAGIPTNHIKIGKTARLLPFVLLDLEHSVKTNMVYKTYRTHPLHLEVPKDAFGWRRLAASWLPIAAAVQSVKGRVARPQDLALD